MHKNGLKALFFFLSATLAISFCAQASSTPRVFIVGDSASAVFGAERAPEFGWGMLLPCGLRNAQVLDYARPGVSGKAFIKNGQLQRMAQQLQHGDTLLIAYGDTQPPAGSGAQKDFRQVMKTFIAVAHARGVVPVLVTPAVRPSFVAGRLVDNHAANAATVRALAGEMHVALIDLDKLSANWLQSVGADQAGRYYLEQNTKLPWRTGQNTSAPAPENWLPWQQHGYQDDTRLRELGARVMANMLTGSLAKLPIPLAAHAIVNSAALTRPVPTGNAMCE